MHDPPRATPWTAIREGSGQSTLYHDLAEELDALLRGETDPVANAANTAAAIYHSLPDLNWVGFYFVRGQELVLGPFQGKPACVRIPLGKGGCGTAAAERRSVLVADVHAFPGHIACDSASNSEIVIPLVRNRRLLGVLDIDSPRLDRFAEPDRVGCEAIAALYIRSLDD